MIYSFFTNGFEVVEGTTPIDLLRRAEIEVTTVSLLETREVESSSKIVIKTDKLFSDCDFSNLDGIILTGGPGTKNYLNCEELLFLIEKSYQSKKLISAICAAPKILAKVGIDEPSTIYPSMKNEVKNYVSAAVVSSGNIITGEGVSAAIDFALEIIKHIKGEEKSAEIAKSIVRR